jgi:hypothetical protein
MNRRDWLTVFGAALVVPLPLPHDLLALGRRLRARATPGGGAPLQALSPQQSELVATIAELIIPQTDTPGARGAGVPQFIDLALAEWLDIDDRQRFLAGLAEVDARSRKAFGHEFTACTPQQQTDFLTLLDAEVAGLRDADKQGTHREPTPSQGFFRMMKRLTLFGYFTSEVGVTEELHNPIIPGRYDGCVLLEQRGK